MNEALVIGIAVKSAAIADCGVTAGAVRKGDGMPESAHVMNAAGKADRHLVMRLGDNV